MMGKKIVNSYSRDPDRYNLGLLPLSLKKLGNCIFLYLSKKRLTRVKNKSCFPHEALFIIT